MPLQRGHSLRCFAHQRLAPAAWRCSPQSRRASSRRSITKSVSFSFTLKADPGKITLKPSELLGDDMALIVADLAKHIVALRKLYARVLEADIELLRRAYGESIVEEALQLADGGGAASVTGSSAPSHTVRLISADQCCRRSAAWLISAAGH
jgi:hypothetical protein